MIGNFLAAFIAARWFRVRQGLVVGVLTAANAAGQLIFLPTHGEPGDQCRLARDVAAARGFGRAFIPLIALLMRDRPEDLGLAPYGASTPSDPRRRSTAIR